MPSQTRILLTPRDEAHRLWASARAAMHSDEENLEDLFRALDFGTRAAEILVALRLLPVRRKYPATIAALLEPPPPEVDAARDAIHPPRTLQFLDALDLLSQEDLSCISPDLHRGWEDRRFSCRRSREKAHQATGVVLEEKERNDLLALCAWRNRIFRMHPPVEVVPGAIRSAFPALENLVEHLDPGNTGQPPSGGE